MGFGSKIDTPSSSREGGVVGLNFQSKENLIESTGSVFTVCYHQLILLFVKCFCYPCPTLTLCKGENTEQKKTSGR